MGLDGKLRFCVATVSAELAMPEAEVSAKLRQLFQLAPGIERRVGEVKTADLVRMVASIPDVVAAFVRLREILPGADLGKIVESRPSVLLEDLDALGKRVRDLKEETPRLNWDAILTDFPQMFEIRDMAANARELRRKFPEGDATEMLGRQPTLLLAMQSGEDMIAYDHGSLRRGQGHHRGGPDARRVVVGGFRALHTRSDKRSRVRTIRSYLRVNVFSGNPSAASSHVSFSRIRSSGASHDAKADLGFCAQVHF